METKKDTPKAKKNTTRKTPPKYEIGGVEYTLKTDENDYGIATIDAIGEIVAELGAAGADASPFTAGLVRTGTWRKFLRLILQGDPKGLEKEISYSLLRRIVGDFFAFGASWMLDLASYAMLQKQQAM